MKRFFALCTFILLLLYSCVKYSDDRELVVDGELYRPHVLADLFRPFPRNHLYDQTYSNIRCFSYYSDLLFSDKTEDLYNYSVEFEVYINEDVFSEGSKIKITGDISDDDWYKKDPKDYASIEGTKACLWMVRSWRTDTIDETVHGIPYYKRFLATDGWISISKNDSGKYYVEYLCTVVAYDDGEKMRIKGSYCKDE